MKGMFYFPPEWSHSHPHMDIPAMMPYLREFDIKACDLNVQYRIYQRGRENLDKCLDRINEFMAEPLVKKYEMIYHFLIENKVRVEYILHNAERFVNPEDYLLTSVYEKNLQLFHKRAYGKEGNIDSFKTISDVMKAVDNKENNYYLDFYESYFREHSLKDIDMVLISLAGKQQIVSAFTLCGYLKKNYPAVKIVVVGKPFTKAIHKINQSWHIFFERLFDYIMILEGEYAVYDFVRCIALKEDINSVPNCIHMEKGTVIKNAAGAGAVDRQDGYTPDFGIYDLAAYNVPKIVLPYSIAGGRYWKKYSLFHHDFGYAGCLRSKSVERIVNDLCIYQEKYHAEYIRFVDEAIPPKVIKKICRAILEKKLKIQWFTNAKASRQYTKEVCSLMEKAGTVFVSTEMDACRFLGPYIFEKDHLVFWASEKQKACNKNLLLKEVSDGKLYLYLLIAEKFYVLPERLESAIKLFDKNIEELEKHLQTKYPYQCIEDEYDKKSFS